MPTYGNLISTDTSTDEVYVHVGITSAYSRSFPLLYPQVVKDVSGLAFDGVNLLSLDLAVGKVFVHQGINATITTSFVVFGTTPNIYGLTYTGVYLSNACVFNNRIYVYLGVSNTPHASFASPASSPRGLTFDSVNLISCDRVTDRIYLHQGISAVVTANFATPGTDVWGLAFDSLTGNLISSDQNGLWDPSQIYIHDGITSTILESFQAPGYRCRGITYDLPWFVPQPPTGLLVCDIASSIGAEGECIPAEIRTHLPYFSAIFNHSVGGSTGEYYQIQVNTESDFSGTMLWDSGKTSINSVNIGERCENINYGGGFLSTGVTYYWRIGFWDNNDYEGAWSVESACFKILSMFPYNLLCEQTKNPTNVGDPRPEFSAINP